MEFTIKINFIPWSFDNDTILNMGIFVIAVVIVILGILLIIVAPYIKKLEKGGSGVKVGELLPFQLKKYFFSRSEGEFMRILEEQLDHARFTIFPKVRLSDFVEITAKGNGKWGSWNKIKSKHIDFLIYDKQKNSIAVAIELDGNSHNGDRMKKSDDFKDRLYPAIGLELVRVKVGTDFSSEIAGILKKL